MRRPARDRAAFALVLGALAGAVALAGLNGRVDTRPDTGERSAAAAAPVVTGAGRIDLAVGEIGPGPDAVEVTGWVYGTDPPTVTVTSRERSVSVLADQERFDVAPSSNGETAWGFHAELTGRLDPMVCVAIGTSPIDCAWFACSSEVFQAEFVDELADAFPGQRFTAHVVDTRTDCTYALRPDLSITTASVVKLEILGGVLLEAQQEGRELTAAERRNIDAMMRLSLNPETGALWVQLGGVPGMTALDRTFGATDTRQGQAFGATWSTAEDRTTIALAVLDGRGPLGWDAVRAAWDVMADVHHTQQWGVSAGVGEDFRVVNKNGFFPMRGYGWRLGSTGFVADPDGGGYAVTIMTDNNPDQRAGIELVEEIGHHISRRLTWGPVAERPFDRAECILHTGGRSWTSLTVELGLPADRWDEVRRTAGGDGPMTGQLVCVP